MTTLVTKTGDNVRLVTGKLADYITINWSDFSLTQLETLLPQIIRFEIENNYQRHKDYKDKHGANVEVFRKGEVIRVSSQGDELLVIQDSKFNEA